MGRGIEKERERRETGLKGERESRKEMKVREGREEKKFIRRRDTRT